MTLDDALTMCPLIAILRSDTGRHLDAVVDLLIDAGFRALEITLSTPDCSKVISTARDRYAREAAIGAGTVLSAADVDLVVAAGGQFVVAPNTDPAVIRAAAAAGLATVPGAMTPTEMLTAVTAGASAIKLFPARRLGPDYLRDVLAPLPNLRLVPVGGIDIADVEGYLTAGAAAVGIGSPLIGDALRTGDLDGLRRRAARFGHGCGRSGMCPHFTHDPVLGRTFRSLSDDFTGSMLSAQWSWIREPAAGTVTVSGGSLRFLTQNADLHPGAPPASILTEPAPAGDYVVETKVSVDVPAEGCCQNFVQGGVLIYYSDAQYIKLASSSIWNTRQTEFGKEQVPALPGFPDYGNGVVGPVGNSTYLRIEAHRHCTESSYTAYTSLDGRHWDKGDTWTQPTSNSTKIGLISMAGSGFTSTFDYVTVRSVVDS